MVENKKLLTMAKKPPTIAASHENINIIIQQVKLVKMKEQMDQPLMLWQPWLVMTLSAELSPMMLMRVIGIIIITLHTIHLITIHKVAIHTHHSIRTLKPLPHTTTIAMHIIMPLLQATILTIHHNIIITLEEVPP